MSCGGIGYTLDKGTAERLLHLCRWCLWPIRGRSFTTRTSVSSNRLLGRTGFSPLPLQPQRRGRRTVARGDAHSSSDLCCRRPEKATSTSSLPKTNTLQVTFTKSTKLFSPPTPSWIMPRGRRVRMGYTNRNATFIKYTVTNCAVSQILQILRPPPAAP